MILYQDAYFEVEQVDGCPIPGYLIVRPKMSVRSLDRLSAETLAQLGPLLAKGMAAIEKAVQAERVYVIRLGEEVESIHFHLFPRTREMADLYRKEFPDDPVINGAKMFDWARKPEVVNRIAFKTTIEKTIPFLKEALGVR